MRKWICIICWNREGFIYTNPFSIYYFWKGKDKDIISVNCGRLLNSLGGKVKKVEIYHNPYTTVIESDIKGANILDIFTRQEV